MTALLIALAISTASPIEDTGRFSFDFGLCVNSELLDACGIDQGITFEDKGVSKADMQASHYHRSAYFRLGPWAAEFQLTERIPRSRRQNP